MDLRGFKRGAKLMFRLPSGRLIALLDAILTPTALLSGCSPLFTAYIVTAIPIALWAFGRPYITPRRAFGFTPLFLAWASLLSYITGYRPLLAAPPSILMSFPLRFLADSPIGSYLLAIAPVLLSIVEQRYSDAAASMVLAATSVAAVEILAARFSHNLSGAGGWSLARSFLNYALLHDKSSMEEALKRLSRPGIRPVYVIELLQGGKVWGVLVIPHVHPGPYKNLGSSAMPRVLIEAGEKRGVVTVVLHGASTHGDDLPSTEELNRLTKMIFEKEGETICEGETLSFTSISTGGLRITALNFNDAATMLIAERLNEGMEDIPLSLIRLINHPCPILVDAHSSYCENCPSPSPYNRLGTTLASLANKAIESAPPPSGGWRVGIAAFRKPIGEEIGKGGITVAFFSNQHEEFILLVFDSNNAMPHFKREIYSRLSTAHRHIVLTTTDTHEIVGLHSDYSYKPLGSTLDPSTTLTLLEDLINRAKQNAKPLKYRVKRFYFDSLFLDSATLAAISRAVEKSIKDVKILLVFYIFSFILPLLPLL